MPRHDRSEEHVLAGKMAVDRALGHPGLGGDGIHGDRPIACMGEEVGRCGDDRRPLWGCGVAAAGIRLGAVAKCPLVCELLGQQSARTSDSAIITLPLRASCPAAPTLSILPRANVRRRIPLPRAHRPGAAAYSAAWRAVSRLAWTCDRCRNIAWPAPSMSRSSMARTRSSCSLKL